jgi:RNA polymerase sigma-70 factor (ECF subfamily)
MKPPNAAAPSSDEELVEALRRGDEEAFVALVDAYSSSLLRVVMTYVASRAVAEEVVQETWLGVVKGLDGFEGRSSVKTWIFKIASNIARSRAVRDRRCVPFSSLAMEEAEGSHHSVDPDRFFPPDHARYPGHWALGPTRWETPDERLLSSETREVIRAAVEQLPAAQRLVITLRDIEGWPADEVCEALDLADGNQRVLLHRARSKVRAALERYFTAVEMTS